ncbi:MAG: response regulator [Candidatus Omnitrophica bacterium]|nr:response regulator [Candidatus Omnitrophota bacterium]
MKDKRSVPKLKILIVDDQEGIVSFLNEFFTNKHYDVVQATNGNVALKMVKTEAPQIVLLDIRLGWGKDGIEVLKEIKAMAPDTRVVMMTSVADDEVVQEAFSLGADDYIIKPFSLVYLEKVVMLKVLNLAIKRIGDG